MERVTDRESPHLRRLPHPGDGDQTTEIDIRKNPRMAQNLVAGLESPSSENLPARSGGKRPKLNQTGQ